MDKQMTLSAFSDELAQVRTKKKEFLEQIERIVPWKEWLAMIQPQHGLQRIGFVAVLLQRRARQQTLSAGDHAAAVSAAKPL